MHILASVCVFHTKYIVDAAAAVAAAVTDAGFGFVFIPAVTCSTIFPQTHTHTHTQSVTRLKCNWNVSFIYAYTNMHKIGENISEMAASVWCGKAMRFWNDVGNPM